MAWHLAACIATVGSQIGVELVAATCCFIANVPFQQLRASILEQKSLQRSNCESQGHYFLYSLINFMVQCDLGSAVQNSISVTDFRKYSPFGRLTGIEGPGFFERYLGAALLAIIAWIHKCFHRPKFD